MPFDQPTPRSLTPVSVCANAPTASGIYGISNACEWIYIGETDNIQATLLSHLHELDTSLMKRQPTGSCLRGLRSSETTGGRIAWCKNMSPLVTGIRRGTRERRDRHGAGAEGKASR